MKALLVATAVSAALLSGCSDSPEVKVPQIDLSEVNLPSVDWKQYTPELREEVEGLVENADCEGLSEELNAADPELERYLQAALEEAGC